MIDQTFLDRIKANEGHGSQLSELLNSHLEGSGSSLSAHDRQRNKQLGGSLGQGATGLSYLLGMQKPQVETFYDKHPTQAVGRNVADSAVGIGAGVAGLGTIRNLYKDHSTNTKADAARASLNPTDGKGKPNNVNSAKAEGGAIDVLGKPNSPSRQNILQRLLHDEIQQNPELGHYISNPQDYAPTTKHKQTFPAARTASDDTLKGYAKGSGKVQGFADLHGVMNKIKHSIGGNHDQGVRSLERELPKHVGPMDQHNPLVRDLLTNVYGGDDTKANAHFDGVVQRHTRNSVGHLMEDSFNHGQGGKINQGLHGFMQKLKGALPSRIHDAKVSPGALRMGSFAKKPALMGGAIAAGGMALSPLIHMLHKRLYGDDQINEWTKNLRATKGKFDQEDE